MEIGQWNCYGCKIAQESAGALPALQNPLFYALPTDQTHHSAHYARTEKKAR
ncbi:MAG TPA: hypothetical protein VN361_03800 [Oxalicibacterium sp.]|nr:hypothetical protein [Oxalicibacterium sp.]